MTKTFFLSGGLGESTGLGDCIYALPLIKAAGGGTFVYGGSKKSHELLRGLMEQQSYIKAFAHVSEFDMPRDFVCLDLFRNSPLNNNGHLVNTFLDYFGYPHYDFEKDGPWLEVDDLPGHYLGECCVVNITPRYRDKIFRKYGGWNKEIERLCRIATPFFLGTHKEYGEACLAIKAMEWVPYHPTSDLLRAAQIVKGAKEFVGTQSALLAIRQGLGLPYRFEWSPNHVDVCQFSSRETRINTTTRKVHLAYATLKRLADPLK